MKRLIIILFLLIMSVGCGMKQMVNTPTKQVEIFLNKYQSLDKDVLNDLDRSTSLDPNFNNTQRETYKDLMKKHYRALRYEIKDEVVDGDKAIVTVEIEVTDYSKTMRDAELYYEENAEEFQDENGISNLLKFSEYRLNQLVDVKDKVKYTLDLSLTKHDNTWKVDQINTIDEEKIQGIYMY